MIRLAVVREPPLCAVADRCRSVLVAGVAVTVAVSSAQVVRWQADPDHSTRGRGREAERQHELLFGLSQHCVYAGLIFCQAGTPGQVGLPLALSLRLAQGILSPPGQQSLIFSVSVPRRLPDTPDEVLKLTSRDLHPDRSVRVGHHLALVPDETHPMTEIPEPGVLARAVLPQARPTTANGDLQFDQSLGGLVDGADPGDRAGIGAEGIRGVDHVVHSV